MILSQTIKPKNKKDLIKTINTMKNVDFEVWEDVRQRDMNKLNTEMMKFIGPKEGSIVVFKKR